MVINYSNGDIFLKENSSFLDENKYLSAFFYFDAPLLKEVNKNNYVLKVFSNNKKLLALKLEPFNLLIYGDKDCLKELLIYIKENDYEIKGIFTSEDLGNHFLTLSKDILKKEYKKSIGMDFMEAHEISEESSKEVEFANEKDVSELYECLINFFIDCELPDRPDKEKILSNISTYRIIRKDNKIVSFARKSPETENSYRISAVYTRPEYRNQKLARKVVNYLKNEVIKEGKIVTLNVDQNNPISYHLYTSLGFKKVFAQAIYVPIDL